MAALGTKAMIFIATDMQHLFVPYRNEVFVAGTALYHYHFFIFPQRRVGTTFLDATALTK